MSAPWWIAVLCCGVLAPVGSPLAGWLKSHGIGKRIRVDGPQSHQIKLGTATMGGLLFVVPGVVVGLGLAAFGYPTVLWPTLALGLFGALGAFDDLRGLRDRQGVGWLARQKFPCQWAIGLVLAIGMYLTGHAAPFRIPFTAQTFDIGVWYIPLAAFVLVGMANAVNFTDGLDGLAAGVGAIILALFGFLAGHYNMLGLAHWTMILLGGLLAFLWHNVHPASMFMGDIGSEALGATLGALALTTGDVVLLAIAGVVCVAEVLSVVAQVAYFKYTRRRYGEGKRLFRMAPFHHHLELEGWSETTITLRLWLITLLATLVALSLSGIG